MLSPRINNALASLGIPEHDYSTWRQFNLCHDDMFVYIAKRSVPLGTLLTDRKYWHIVTNIYNVEGVTYDV